MTEDKKGELLALAKGCEAATGPSYDLDIGIWRAVFGGRGSCYPDDDPLYTVSLDAAITLVPDDYDWAVFHTNGGLTFHAWCGTREDVFGDTPTLALCAAALRARAATPPVESRP